MLYAIAWLIWSILWWSLPAACCILGGQFSNFIGLMVCVAATTTWAGWNYIYRPWKF